MTGADHATGAALLRQLRESRGWSWAELARALRDTARQVGTSSLINQQVASIQRTIARWESLTDQTSPGERYQFLLAHLYAHTAGGSTALGAGSDFDQLLEALRHFGTSEARVGELADLVRRTASRNASATLALRANGICLTDAVGLRDPTRPSDGLLARLAASVATINEQIGCVPFVRLQLQLAPAVDTCRQLVGGAQQAGHAKLFRLATEVFALAARLSFETRDDAAAVRLYQEATNTAGRLTDRRHRAMVRTSHTMVTLHATQDVDFALRIVKAAVADAHRGSSYAARARAHAVHAEVCARASLSYQAHSALESAWKIVNQLRPDDPHAGFNADRLNGFEGLCELHVGAAERAHDRLNRSVATLDQPRDIVQRGIVSTDVALARLRLGDPVACVEILHRAVDITADTGGRVAAVRIRQARRQLRPWRTEAFLADLDDHIHDKLIGR